MASADLEGAVMSSCPSGGLVTNGIVSIEGHGRSAAAFQNLESLAIGQVAARDLAVHHYERKSPVVEIADRAVWRRTRTN